MGLTAVVVVGVIFSTSLARMTVVENATALVISNGLVSLTMPRNGTATQAKLKALQLHASNTSVDGVNLLGSNGAGYYDMNTNDWRLKKPFCVVTSAWTHYKVLRKTEKLLEVAFYPPGACGFVQTLHYMLKQGESGYYMWAVVHTDPEAVAIQKRNGNHKNNISLGQSRMVLRLDPHLFKFSAVVDESSADQPFTMRTAAIPAPGEGCARWVRERGEG